jgi:hypothetical protein
MLAPLVAFVCNVPLKRKILLQTIQPQFCASAGKAPSTFLHCFVFHRLPELFLAQFPARDASPGTRRGRLYLSPAPQALPQAAGFSSGAAAPQALPQAAGFSSGADAPQAVPGTASAVLFHPNRLESAISTTSVKYVQRAIFPLCIFHSINLL